MQGPKDNTVGDFWSIVWVHHVDIIVMLTSLEEGGKVKCARYWPESGHEIFDQWEVNILGEQTLQSFTVRKLKLTRLEEPEEERIVTQYHVTDWGDYSVPDTTTSLINTVTSVRDVNKVSSPILVHCSAGVGRTGTFIAVYRIIQSLLSTILVHTLPSPWDTVLDMRKARPKMVQKREQYLFIFKCIQDFLAMTS